MWRSIIKLTSNGRHTTGTSEPMHWRSPVFSVGFLPKMHELNRIMRKHQTQTETSLQNNRPKIFTNTEVTKDIYRYQGGSHPPLLIASWKHCGYSLSCPDWISEMAITHSACFHQGPGSWSSSARIQLLMLTIQPSPHSAVREHGAGLLKSHNYK